MEDLYGFTALCFSNTNLRTLFQDLGLNGTPERDTERSLADFSLHCELEGRVLP